MNTVPISQLYLAFRQAKIAQYFERRGIGLLQLAAFEENLPEALQAVQEKLAQDAWFSSIDIGDALVCPKSIRHSEKQQQNGVVAIGAGSRTGGPVDIDISLRLCPTPEFLIAEVLYLWRFGPALESVLSEDVLGYRLDLRAGSLNPYRRWIFEYWPKAYERFRTVPLEYARRRLKRGSPVTILSADLASFYDTVDPSFMLNPNFIEKLHLSERMTGDYINATKTLNDIYGRYRALASARIGVPVDTGIPVGSLTSRIIANVALSTLDDYVVRQEGVSCYKRYVDDIVVVADGNVEHDLEEAVGRLLPLRSSADGIWPLNVDALERKGCKLKLQQKKVRVHLLVGNPGMDFVDAVASDFAQLVSERRAFLDMSAISEDGIRNLIRATEESGGGSRLRVLRDADRVRLERYSLSTSLKSLERISSMVDPDQVQSVVQKMITEAAKGIDAEDNWVENLDICLRLLKVAIVAGDS
jgi:hypothetical protein